MANIPDMDTRKEHQMEEKKHNDEIVELNTAETEQVVGGKMVRAPLRITGEPNTVNTNPGNDAFRGHGIDPVAKM